MLMALALRELDIRLLIIKNYVRILKRENCLITGARILAHIHTSTYRVNNSITHYRMIGQCMCVIFTTILLKHFSTNSVAMMKYLAGVMALGIHHCSSSY